MTKVLIYSSKEIYDKASFAGRAEAHLIAYREDEHYYRIVKNRTSQYMYEKVVHWQLGRFIEWAERDDWQRDKEAHERAEQYKTHPVIELMKNA
jgi:ethanolamine ammonia-lyase large subunit